MKQKKVYLFAAAALGLILWFVFKKKKTTTPTTAPEIAVSSNGISSIVPMSAHDAALWGQATSIVMPSALDMTA